MDGQEATTLFAEAKARYNDGQYNEAMRILTRLNHFYPDAKNVLFPMALCLEKLNHTGEAQEICNRLIARFDDPRAHEMKARIENAFVVSAVPMPNVGDDLAGDLLGPTPTKKTPVATRQTSAWVWYVVGGVGALFVLGLLAMLGALAAQSAARSDSSAGLLVGIMLVSLLIGIGAYLFACYCLKLICEKAGEDPGILVWIPALQIIPVFKAAGMSLAWVILFFIPVINIVASIVLWIKLCEARGKPSWMGILSIIPGANLFLILYLAFSE